MAKKKHRKKARATLPLAVVAGFVPPARIIYAESQANGIEGGAVAASRIFLGYDSNQARWDFQQLQYGFGPILVGFAIHKIAAMVGINRALASAKIPFIRI